jgi:hypothetical protein
MWTVVEMEAVRRATMAFTLTTPKCNAARSQRASGKPRRRVESEPERMTRLLCVSIADGSVPLIAAKDLAPLSSDFVDESNIDALVAIFNNHNDSLVVLKAVVQRGKALAALNALPGVKVARVKRAAAPERWVMTRWTGGAKNVGDKVQE